MCYALCFLGKHMFMVRLIIIVPITHVLTHVRNVFIVPKAWYHTEIA